jgi:CRP-like cAMP-binding protein
MLANEIIRALPPREFKLIGPRLKEVQLEKGALLHDVGQPHPHVYFPAGAIVSYFSGTTEGQTIEVCVVGKEGIVGAASVLSNTAVFRAVVQVEGTAYRLPLEALRQELKRCDVFRGLVMAHINALIVQVAQTAVCNKFHSVEERFCRWLLLAHDRSADRGLALTQDALGRILGTRRATVTVVAGLMQKAGLIKCRRGMIAVVDRRRLEARACECYESIVLAYARMRKPAGM